MSLHRTANRSLGRLLKGTENALEMMRLGRLSDPVHSPFRVVHRTPIYALRHYGEDDHRPIVAAPILLVPPLMLTSEIYDMSPDVSAVAALLRAGMNVYLVDFGAPESAAGGMDRTLDDHVKAVSDAVDLARAATGHDVHLAGYSQGGMFAYQVAAMRKSEGIASVITFGSPVDIYRNLPLISADVAAPIYAAARSLLDFPIQKTRGLPGFLTSTAFKVLSVRKEVSQLVEFVGKLHDRQALERQESRRRFLGGEGFVAWPGPALRTFIDEFIVQNRMSRGGFVLDGRPVSLADIRCPVLFFVGHRDAIAQPAAVRAVRRAIPHAELFEVGVRAGHFGLVVGGRSLELSWPTTIAWVKWREGMIPKPPVLDMRRDVEVEDPEDAAWEDVDLDLGVVIDGFAQAAGNAWKWIGEATGAAAAAVSSMSHQLPRLAQLNAMTAETKVGIGRALAERADQAPDSTLFLWKGRAFSSRDAERRVDAVVRGLVACGVRHGEHVGVMMEPRPSLLTVVTALNRMGAVSVLFDPDERRVTLSAGLEAVPVDRVITDPEHAARVRRVHQGDVFSLGGGGPARSLPDGVVDMEAIDPATVALPEGFVPNDGAAADLALVLFTTSRDERTRPARITNRRWAVSALGAAATCTLTSKDTVHCCLPLHHPSGLLVAVGGALVGGARISLSTRFDPATFWPEVRRYGASVVFYAGDMMRPLVEAPVSAADNDTPVRLFAGSGMPAGLWRTLGYRFPHAGVLEFYATTEGNAVLANASGEKVGSVGRPLPGSAELALLAYDFERDELVRDGAGRCRRVPNGTAGLLHARIDDERAMKAYDGYLGDREGRVRYNVFTPGDMWYATSDVLLCDRDGDYFMLGSARDVVLGPDGPVFSREIEDAFERLYAIRAAASYAIHGADGRARAFGVAVELRSGASEAEARRDIATLPTRLAPAMLCIVDALPRTAGYGLDRERLAALVETQCAALTS